MSDRDRLTPTERRRLLNLAAAVCLLVASGFIPAIFGIVQ